MLGRVPFGLGRSGVLSQFLIIVHNVRAGEVLAFAEVAFNGRQVRRQELMGLLDGGVF